MSSVDKLTIKQWDALPKGQQNVDNFAKLTDSDKTTVVNRRLSQQIIKPLLDQATSRAKTANQDMLAALKGQKK
ncbi:hypothetical protein A2311_01515 [candidate division WOR-1 bacterium RIFOXYB2_FULL_48_7]|uniref:Uncharacterized protein n=1 Tax=candidate division WOR-1 bacterium RIFOXYB2_FULL_48_7 TaxID=1802583 RepID=A0A1F4TRR9_UNCSA|nr:MAG: hypothetical protein A2311_01515 [candidate division WOR-1 bacterium RIFOXYB2_FULL_48_7]